jgi:5-methylcytosine-specific restriction endonuclease McrA
MAEKKDTSPEAEERRRKQREWMRQWTAKNRERINAARRAKSPEEKARLAAKRREWRAKNPGRDAEACRRNWKKHREKRLQEQRERYQKNREARIQAMREWNEKHKAWKSEYMRGYYPKQRERRIADPLKYLAWQHRAYANTFGAPGSFTAEDVLRQFEQQDGKCGICKAEFPPKGRFYRFTVDHFIPLSKGGTNDAENIWLLCDHCNKSKSNKILTDQQIHDCLKI